MQNRAALAIRNAQNAIRHATKPYAHENNMGNIRKYVSALYSADEYRCLWSRILVQAMLLGAQSYRAWDPNAAVGDASGDCS
jgi:hypothetical protein